MIKSFGNKVARDVYDGTSSRNSQKLPKELHDKTRRLLDQINSAPSLEFLQTPPGNRLEKLRGDLSGYWSLRINDTWRITFRWRDNDFHDIKIIDYH